MAEDKAPKAEDKAVAKNEAQSDPHPAHAILDEMTSKMDGWRIAQDAEVREYMQKIRDTL